MHQDQNIAQTEQNLIQVSCCVVTTGDLAESLDLSSSSSPHLKREMKIPTYNKTLTLSVFVLWGGND